MQVSSVWSCARLITETVGSLPLGVFEKTPEGRDENTSHYLYKLFRESPNALMTCLEFREAMTLSIVLWGNAYAVITWDGTPFESEVSSLMPLRVDCMLPRRLGQTVTYHYSTTEGTHVFAKESILHIKGFGADGIMGLSPLAYAAQSMGMTLSADKYAARAFGKGGMPVGKITTDKILTPDQRIQLRALYDNVNADDAAGTWLFEGGTDYAAISIPPDQLQMLQSRSFQLGEIARIFRVPSHLINDTEKSTSWGSGIEQLNLGWLAYGLRPYLTRWETAVSSSLLSRTDRRKYFIEHNVEGLLRADSVGRAAFYSSAAQNAWMTRNEIRRKENLPPMDGGDDLTVQVNMTPLELLGKLSQPATPVMPEKPMMDKPMQGEPQGDENA